MRGSGPAELVLGSVQLGLAYGAANRTGKPRRAAALRLVRRATEAGIRVFDTARGYGDAEERLAEAFAGRSFATITKLSSLNDLTPDASRNAIRSAVDKSVGESLAALKRGTLDCLLLHRARHMTAFGGAVWERLKELLEAGTVGSLGVSVQSPEEAHQALSDPLVRHIQLPFNLLDWRWREAGVVDAIRARRPLAVHVRSVFLQGLIAARNPDIWPAIPGVHVKGLIGWFEDCARAYRRENPADLALGYVRGQDWIDGIVVGMETEAQLEDNLALFKRPPLSAEDCSAIEASRPRVPAELLDPAKWPRA
jgi:aryl-alcohol dehydrogenase-like predicted oxidoreductase